MKSTSLALLAVVMSTVVLAGCMGAKPATEEVMVDTGSTAEAVVETVTEEVVPEVMSGAEAVVSGAAEVMSGAEAVVNQVVNEVTTAQ